MRTPAVTFRAKVAFLLAGVILLLGVIAVLYARYDMRRILEGELERRGEAIAKDLAANSADLLLTGDLVGLYDLVNRAKVNNADVRYVLVVDPRGEVQANTFGRGVPPGLLEANLPLPEQPVRLRRLKTEEGLIRDVAVAVLGSRAGFMRVGMSDRSIGGAVDRNTRSLMILVAVAVAIGLAVSYWLSWFLTRPLRQLLAAVWGVARGDLSQRVASPARDEVGQLGSAFNIMAGELEAKEAARRDLMEKVISSQEAERKRVARELHDELAQRLTSVLLSLEAVEATQRGAEPAAKQTVSRAWQVTASSLAETRKLIADLRPTVLDDFGLVPAIRSYAEDHLRPGGTEAVVTATDVTASLPAAMNTAVFRIVQEAINNIARHAQAKQARVSLRVTNGAFLGEVADDGQGFEPARFTGVRRSRGAGLGLQGMEERATLLGGTFRVWSEAGKGTRVSFSIPLPREETRG